MALPQVGQKAARSLKVTADHVEQFAQMTGDRNPLHFDEGFAARTKFGGLVVQGGLTTGLVHALVAMDMPGPGTVFLSQDWRFTAPVFIGDTITPEHEITALERKRSAGLLTLRVTLTNQRAETILEGQHKYLVAYRPL